MKNKINWKTFWYTNIFSFITLAIGIVFTIKPDILTTTCKWIGTIFCIVGAVLVLISLISKKISDQKFSYGVTALIIGILLEIIPILLKVLIPILFGGWILVSSVSGMYRNFIFRHDVPKWWIGFVLCTLSGLLALYIMTRPITVMNETVKLIGIGLIIHAVIRLISSILGKDGYKAAEKTIIETTIQE